MYPPLSHRSARQQIHHRPGRRRVLWCAAALCAGILQSTSAATSPSSDAVDDAPDFATEIRPILASRCLPCHGPDEGTREAGLRLDSFEGATALTRHGHRAIVPGDASASAVLTRIASNDPDLRMPPADTGDPLSAKDVDLIRRWIDAGAEFTPHWAFEPVQVVDARPADDDWARSYIDVLVQRRLEAEGMSPEPEAGRATLIRRVTIDLTGLPPTIEDIDAFLSDTAEDAYERMVDRVLASPHFGERWAQLWLDAARYADTKGYEADRRRTIWPYRDWVIRAYNDDLPFDVFTREQIAGDLIPSATEDQILATAFHRNTMTNDEGGTDNEEFRMAAVIDRTNTTMQAWMGLTMACAQCHTHKFDPITHREYYEFLAFFNNTEDNDEADDRPLLSIPTPEQRDAIAAAQHAHDEAVRALNHAIDNYVPSALPESWSSATSILTLVNDAPPAGATITGVTNGRDWPWLEDANSALSGTRCLEVIAPEGQMRQAFFTNARRSTVLNDGDALIAHVWLHPDNPPTEIMLQWHTSDGSWEHRAYWGDNAIGFGTDGSPSRLPIGDLPGVGAWRALSIDAADVGLVGKALDGVAMTVHSGHARWDAVGIAFAEPRDESWRYDLARWIDAVQTARVPAPDSIRTIAARAESERTDDDNNTLRRHFLQHVSLTAWDDLDDVRQAVADAERALTQARSGVPTVPIMRERPGDSMRASHILAKGSFLSPTDEVTPGVPAALHPLQPIENERPGNRLDLAAWLTSTDNPLTARVQVNRIWAQFFGTGIVDTMDDFGIQGSLPTHPELLDGLARSFMEHGWSVKHMCREIVCSATYRQDSSCAPEKRERDRYNRLFARGPRFRLDAEMIRDQTLASSGLLNRAMYGPPVFPPQPDGVWQMVYSGDQWMTASDENRYRRGIYTFWRRTSPYPSATLFDAPSREYCVTQRIKTNTPLQALVMLNDPVALEAAAALGARMQERAAGARVDEGIINGFRRCVTRQPRDEEVEALRSLWHSERSHYRAHPDDAIALLSSGGHAPEAPAVPHSSGDDDTDAEQVAEKNAESAAWMIVGSVLLNLDEALVRR